MSLWHKRAIANTAVWGLVAIGFLLIAFTDGGPGGLLHGSPPRNTVAVVLVLGILASLAVRYFTRERKGAELTLVDERDQTIARQAAVGSFVSTALYVFLLCIGLDEAFQEVGAVPVGWVWFTAYSSWILAYFAQAVLSLFLYAGIGARAEG
jgi:hypothetical protein